MDPAKPAATEVWRDKQNIICPVNVQPMLDGNILYGMDQKGVMRASRFLRESGCGKHPLRSDVVPQARRRLYRSSRRSIHPVQRIGELLFAKLSPEGYTEIDRVKVIDQTNTAFGRDVVWSMPAFANKHAYIRNDKEIICVDLAK